MISLANMSLWEIAKDTGLISLVATVVALVSKMLVNFATKLLHCKTKEYVIRFMAPLPEELITRVRFYCLIIRYGTDQYIEHMASDIDKQNGELQNRKIDIAVTPAENGACLFSLRIPIHRRLGTQFKCFAEVTDPDDPNAEDILQKLESFLEMTGKVSDISTSSSEHTHRIFFLLNRFTTVESVEGFKNNHCFPE